MLLQPQALEFSKLSYTNANVEALSAKKYLDYLSLISTVVRNDKNRSLYFVAQSSIMRRKKCRYNNKLIMLGNNSRHFKTKIRKYRAN